MSAIGHNNPPEPTPFEVVTAKADDLLLEARNWADGQKVESQAQADAVDALMDKLRAAEKATDEQRVIEKAPLDDQIAEIQDRYNVYIAPLKNKKPGKIPLALDALKKTIEPWLKKLDDDRKAAAAKAAAEAEAAAKAAAEAMAAAQAESSIEGREAAEELVQAAAQAQSFARRVAAPVATGLRTYWTPHITDQKAAILHYMKEQPERFLTLALDLAKEDVRAGKRQIPGFDVVEDKRAA